MKYCANCGAQLDDNAAFCLSCGASVGQRQTQYQQASYQQYQYQQPRPAYQAPGSNVPVNTGKATGSLVCGILSFFIPIVSIVLSIVAIALAGASKNEIGYNLPSANAGRVCGIITLVLNILGIVPIILYFAGVITLGFSVADRIREKKGSVRQLK